MWKRNHQRRLFIKPQIGGSTYRQEPQKASILGGYHRLLPNNTGKLGKQWNVLALNGRKVNHAYSLPPKNCLLTWPKCNQSIYMIMGLGHERTLAKRKGYCNVSKTSLSPGPLLGIYRRTRTFFFNLVQFIFKQNV